MKDFANRGSRRRPGRAPADLDSFDSFLSPNNNRRDHKTAQLCRQAFRSLSLALAECADDVLRDLTVVSVDPAPDATRLLVRVSCGLAPSPASAAGGDDADLLRAADVLARLDAASGFLRREVATAITRKRAPELSFLLVAAGSEGRP